MNLWDITRTAKVFSKKALKFSNVQFITVGLKEKNKKYNKEYAVKVYVKQKIKTLHTIPPRYRIPKFLKVKNSQGNIVGRVKTDVIECAHKPKTCGVRSGHILEAFDGDQGICAISFSQFGFDFLLTNAHVASDVADGQHFERMEILDRTGQEWFDVGEVVHVSNLSEESIATMDLAIVEVQGVYIDEYMILDNNEDFVQIGRPKTATNEAYFYNVNGERFECAYPEKIPHLAIVSVDGVRVRFAKVWQVRMTVGQIIPGHSGALLCRENQNGIIGCGLIFGGASSQYAWFFPFDRVWNYTQKIIDQNYES